MRKSDLEALTHEQLVEFVWGIMRSLRATLDGNLGDKTDTPAPSPSPSSPRPAPLPLPPHTPPTPVPPPTPTSPTPTPSPTYTQDITYEPTSRESVREEGCGEKPETALSPVHAGIRTQEEAKQEEADLTPAAAASVLSTRPTSATLAVGTVSTANLPLYVMQGKQPANVKGSTAPTQVLVHAGTLVHWQEKGWRGDLAWLQESVDACMDYHRGKGTRSPAWGAVVSYWLRNDIKRGEDIRPLRTVSYGQGQGYGANRTGYGYDRNGQPTNKSTGLVTGVQELAEFQRARRMAREAGTDTGTLSDADGRIV